MSATSWFHPAPAPDRLAINKHLLFAILTVEAVAIFVYRLPQTLTFNDFAFFDTGSNLTAQYLISRGYRPALDFGYHYGLLPLLFGRLWFSICGFTPIAFASAPPLMDIFIIWGFVRFAGNLKLNLAGILIIVLTSTLTIPSSLLNFTHGIEAVLLIHALADQAGGNLRRALALATLALFVKPSMAYFVGFVLVALILADCLRNRAQPLRAFVAEVRPAALVGVALGGTLAAIFGLAPVVLTVVPNEGRAMYRAQGFGFLNGAGRLFLAPPRVPWSFYLVSKAGPWILYTVVLVIAALVVARRASKNFGDVERADRTPEVILTCAVLYLSFILFFFGNESSWTYYFFMVVLGLAASARLGLQWEVAVVCLAFAIPIIKLDKAVIQRVAPSRQAASASSESPGSDTLSATASRVETGFGYRLWSTTSPSPETAGLWATPGERDEWIKVLAMSRGHSAAILEYYGCASLLFSEFRPPETLFLVGGESNAGALSRELSQLKTSSMIVLPRWQSQLLDEIPEIGALVRRGFVPAFQGDWFIVYSRREV
jgi:hypothetical protein